MTTLAVEAGDVRRASSTRARSEVYALLSEGFEFPAHEAAPVDPDAWERRVALALAGLPYRVRASDLRWSVRDGQDGLETEYIRLFQIGGRRGPPCSLHSGFYSRDRSRTLQHLLRFYNFFGFGLNDCVMPDHICVQLEFMARLAEGTGADSGSLTRAQRDFTAGQLGWLDELASRVRTSAGAPFYRSLTLLASRFVQADSRFIADEALRGGGHGEN
jgi:DMSO reductase family type II enzyme chaperone